MRRAGLLLAGAALHAGLAVALIGSLAVVLTSAPDPDGGGFVAGWARLAGTVTESLGMPRRQPYVACLLVALLGPPALVGAVGARRLIAGRPWCQICAALAAVAVATVAYALAVEVVAALSPHRLSIIARNNLGFSRFLVPLWGVLYLPVGCLAHGLTRRLHRAWEP